MVKVEEVRWGNAVLDSSGTICTIDQMDYEQWTFDSLDPIPLSPEILEAAGFIKSFTYYEIEFGLNKLSVEIPNGEMNLINEENEVLCLKMPIKHLHQLQNLYFALTGEELEIKIPETKEAV